MARIVALLAVFPLLASADASAQDIQWVQGPATVTLGDQATIELSRGHIFANASDTKRIMEMSGNLPGDSEVGLITSADEESEWYLIFEYFPVGYISDEDQDDIDAKALLKSISEGTEAGNEYRRENGFEALHVIGWRQKPHYDPKTHNLIWSLAAEDDAGEQAVNYNIRLLGRQGYISATLVTGPLTLPADVKEVEKILPNFSYNDGKRYAEFREGDKLAGYGLAALVAGGAGAAALKLGLFAKLGQFLAKAWKLVVVAAIALVGALKKFLGALFGRSSSELA
jgi:uncharacterized membrane-anchored protein